MGIISEFFTLGSVLVPHHRLACPQVISRKFSQASDSRAFISRLSSFSPMVFSALTVSIIMGPRPSFISKIIRWFRRQVGVMAAVP